MALRLVFIGPPGVGKGTQAGILARSRGVPQISTGDILRDAVRNGTELGLEVREFLDGGRLVPDELVVALVADRIAREDCERGFVLDGFPRTVAQAEALEAMLKERSLLLSGVLAIEAPEEEIVGRLGARRVCARCGRIYTAAQNACLADGEPLSQRSDDRPEVVRERLKVYAAQTRPLLDFYDARKMISRINGLGSLDEVSARILKALESMPGGVA